LDTDLDNTGNACDVDDDNDTIDDVNDNCPLISNLNQNDLDSDDTGDVCDSETLITTNTVLTADTSLAGDLVVEPGFVLTINPGVTLDIDSVNHKILVKFGGGILIKSGGTLLIQAPSESLSASSKEFSTSSVIVSSSSTSEESSSLVEICHVAGKKTMSVEVNQNAVDAHLRHGDTLGSCTSSLSLSTESSTSVVLQPSSSIEDSQELVEICHVAGKKTMSVEVNQNAVDAHLRHGDTLGLCE